MDNIVRIIKSRENLGALTDWISETVKHEIKRQEGGFLGMLLGILDPSMLENMLTGKGIMRAGRGVVDIIIWIIWIKLLSNPSFKQYRGY